MGRARWLRAHGSGCAPLHSTSADVAAPSAAGAAAALGPETESPDTLERALAAAPSARRRRLRRVDAPTTRAERIRTEGRLGGPGASSREEDRDLWDEEDAPPQGHWSGESQQLQGQEGSVSKSPVGRGLRSAEAGGRLQQSRRRRGRPSPLEEGADEDAGGKPVGRRRVRGGAPIAAATAAATATAAAAVAPLPALAHHQHLHWQVAAGSLMTASSTPGREIPSSGGGAAAEPPLHTAAAEVPPPPAAAATAGLLLAAQPRPAAAVRVTSRFFAAAAAAHPAGGAPLGPPRVCQPPLPPSPSPSSSQQGVLGNPSPFLSSVMHHRATRRSTPSAIAGDL